LPASDCGPLQPPKSHGGPCHTTGVPVPPSPGTWQSREASSRLCDHVGSAGKECERRSRTGLGRAPHRPRGSPARRIQLVPSRHVVGDMVNAESHVQGRCDCLPSPPGDMPYIVCAISCPYLLPARWTLPRPRASLPSTDSTSRVRSLSAWPRGWGAVLRSASFRNTVALRLHVIPTRYGSHLR